MFSIESTICCWNMRYFVILIFQACLHGQGRFTNTGIHIQNKEVWGSSWQEIVARHFRVGPQRYSIWNRSFLSVVFLTKIPVFFIWTDRSWLSAKGRFKVIMLQIEKYGLKKKTVAAFLEGLTVESKFAPGRVEKSQLFSVSDRTRFLSLAKITAYIFFVCGQWRSDSFKLNLIFFITKGNMGGKRPLTIVDNCAKFIKFLKWKD